MSDYINREDAIKAISNGEPPEAHYPFAYIDKINKVPSADVEPVNYGYWIDDEKFEYANCSKCGLQIEPHEIRGYWRYCPNCGAKMIGKPKED